MKLKTQRNIQRVKLFLRDPDKKPYLIILKEVISLWFNKKEFPKHYFGRFFYRNNGLDYTKFMSMKEYYAIIESNHLRYPASDSILHNKLSFDIFSKRYDIPRAKVISHNFGAAFFYNNKKRILTNHIELEKYFISIFESEKKERLFLKLIQGQQGRSAMMVDKRTLHEKSISIWEHIKESDFIHQEVITQHERISAVFEKAVNTLRLETYVDKNQDIHLLGSYMRFGFGNAIVDNASSGGIFVPVNIDTGILFDKGMTNLSGGSKVYLKHPESGVLFKGFQIPFFDQVKDKVIAATHLLPSRLIGWDIAITPTKPILVEGNYIPGLLYGEYSYKGFFNKPIFKEIMQEAIK